MKTVTIRFYGSLNKLISKNKDQWITCPLRDSRSIKDITESLGVPHTEIGNILVDGACVSFSRNLFPGERVEVFPAFIDVEEVIQVITPPSMPSRFILDVHLGTLAKHLRALGVDTLYDSSYEDEEIVRISLRENRTILTRDRGILKRKEIVNGYLIRSQKTMIQLKEVFINFTPEVKAFSRCMKCNGVLTSVPKSEILHALAPLTRDCYNEFYKCRSCDSIYWKGGHWERMKHSLDTFLSDLEEYKKT